MTTTKGAEMSVTVNNSPIQDYSSCIFTLQAIITSWPNCRLTDNH